MISRVYGRSSAVDFGLRRDWALHWAATRPDCDVYCIHDVGIRLHLINKYRYYVTVRAVSPGRECPVVDQRTVQHTHRM